MFSRALIAAAAVSCGFGHLCDDDWPPARFHGAGTAKVVFATSQAEIDDLCGTTPETTTNGCSNRKRIVLRDPCVYPSDDEFARLACHELAHHFGGWPEDHPL